MTWEPEGLTMKLLGLAGRKFAGKDTFAKLLIEEGEKEGINVVRAAFADKLKVSAATLLGYRSTEVALGQGRALTDTECVAVMDVLKEAGRIRIDPRGDNCWVEISGREFLQWFGTEAHRDVFGADFWVDALLPYNDWREGFKGADLVVVSDVRFESEAARVYELGGRVFEVVRDLPDDGDQHASEAGLPDEYIADAVRNDGTVEDLGRLARSWLLDLMGGLQS